MGFFNRIRPECLQNDDDLRVAAAMPDCLQVKRAFAANFRALAGIKPLDEVPEPVAFGNLFQ
jgi:hypothetical protein